MDNWRNRSSGMMLTPDMVNTTGNTTTLMLDTKLPHTKLQLTPHQLTPPRVTLRTFPPSSQPQLVNSKCCWLLKHGACCLYGQTLMDIYMSSSSTLPLHFLKYLCAHHIICRPVDVSSIHPFSRIFPKLVNKVMLFRFFPAISLSSLD